ncbi:hypothetical protein [Microbacterium halotolerans]|uniref:hypothetical protein n=1 Tax=Microbacterium halotolerans TaxID=246613 RepID=UPI0013C35E0A|nr:hypothetical protein [Microbacterium halotolerans]
MSIDPPSILRDGPDAFPLKEVVSMVQDAFVAIAAASTVGLIVLTGVRSMTR